METQSDGTDGSVVRSSVGTWARLTMAAMALAAMAGCARVSTEHVQNTADRLVRPAVILVHDYQVSSDKVQLDAALSSRIKRALKGTPKTEDQVKVEQEVSRILTSTLVDELRKLGIPAEPARMASAIDGP